jgi:pimeloyl-ACP methyl ester carboxylesterase
MAAKKTIALIAAFIVLSLLFSTVLNGSSNGKETFVNEPVFNSKIYVYESGKQYAKSVVLVHGTGADGAGIWKNLIPELEKKYHVVAFDLPGFARSGRESQMYSPKNYAAFIDWIVKKYTKGPVCIIGHSLGGAIALYYAGTYPNGLERLIVVDSAGILNRSAFIKNFINLKPNKFLDLINIPVSVVQNHLIANLESMDKDLAPESDDTSLTSRYLRKKLYNGDPGKVAGVALLNTDFSAVIDKIAVPTLIVWGENDTIAPLRIGRALELMIPRADLRIMPVVGHTPMSERPADFNKIISDWLSMPVNRKKITEPSFTRNTVFSCEGNDCVLTNGSYERIEVKNSNCAKIANVTAKQISIEGSIASIESSFIKSGDIGLKVVDSVVNVSGCSIDADIAILTSTSSVDLAGVKLTGKTAAIKEAALSAGDKSTIIFSVSKINSPFNNGFKHEIKNISGATPY